MGYYTKYELSVIASNDEACVQRYHLYDDVKSFSFEFDDGRLKDVLDSSAVMKWYRCRDDLTEFSKKYPLLIFQLDCAGQEGEVDVWRAFFKNGKYFEQTAELKFEEPDFSRLD